MEFPVRSPHIADCVAKYLLATTGGRPKGGGIAMSPEASMVSIPSRPVEEELRGVRR